MPCNDYEWVCVDVTPHLLRMLEKLAADLIAKRSALTDQGRAGEGES